jgi:hypothetical protein
MATLQGLAGLVEASNKALDENGNPINPVTTIEFKVTPKGELNAAVTFREGLKEAYRQGDPIFTDSRPPITDKDKSGVGTENLDAQQLEKILNNTPLNLEVQNLEKILSNSPDIAENSTIKIDADAAVKSTVTDTADINIHLEHKDSGKIAGGVEAEFTPEALTGFISQLETSYQQQTPQNPALDVPIQVQDLQMLHPSNIGQVSLTEQVALPSAATEFITEDSLVLLTNDNPPVMQVKFDEKTVDLKKLEAQLNALAEAENKPFGENGVELVKTVMQEIRTQYPKLVERENQVLIVDEIELTNNQPPASQISKPTDYVGITVSQEAQKVPQYR